MVRVERDPYRSARPFTAIGDVTAEGCIWLSPTTALAAGRAAIPAAQAAVALRHGWRVGEELACGRSLVERKVRGAIIARSRWLRSRSGA